MRIALYHRQIDASDREAYSALEAALEARGIEAVCVADGDTVDRCDYLFSIGGDGTLLSSVQFVRSARPGSLPPVVGINFGHLGFLTTAGRDNIEAMVDALVAGNFSLEERTLLEVCIQPAGGGAPEPEQYALNEVFLHRHESASLLRTEVEVDRRHVATYAGDGLIVATPTGSTAYSLSCGGPILTPDSRCFAITPVAAHTLTLRPIVVHDSAELHLRTVPSQHHTGQPSAGGFTLGIDSRRFAFECGTALTLRRAPFTISLVRLGGQDFFSAMRDKLMWGY